MNKQELIESIAAATGETKRTVDAVMVALANTACTALANGEEVTLHNIGKLKAVEKAARTGRNPQTGKSIKIAERTNGKFSPGKNLKNINEKPVKAPAKAKAPAKKK